MNFDTIYEYVFGDHMCVVGFAFTALLIAVAVFRQLKGVEETPDVSNKDLTRWAKAKENFVDSFQILIWIAPFGISVYAIVMKQASLFNFVWFSFIGAIVFHHLLLRFAERQSHWSEDLMLHFWLGFVSLAYVGVSSWNEPVVLDPMRLYRSILLAAVNMWVYIGVYELVAEGLIRSARDARKVGSKIHVPRKLKDVDVKRLTQNLPKPNFGEKKSDSRKNRSREQTAANAEPVAAE